MARELLKRIVLGIMPERCHLPLRFWHAWLTGRLEPEMFLLNQLIGGKKLVIDVGANHGIYSYHLARLGKTVEAFEPLPECARTIKAYASPRIRVHDVALSSATGTARLVTPIVDGVRQAACSSFTPMAGPHEATDVPVRTLDDYEFEDVCLVKIDVEGHELDVLRGGLHTLRREQPVMLAEIEQRHLASPMTAVFEKFLDCGYQGFFYLAGRMQPISAFSFAIHQQPFLDDPYHPAYVNNFLFFPRALPLPALLSRAGATERERTPEETRRPLAVIAKPFLRPGDGHQDDGTWPERPSK